MQEIIRCIQQNHTMVLVIAGIIMLAVTIFAFIYDKNAKRAIKRSLLESQLIMQANALFEDLCDPRTSRICYRFCDRKFEILKEDVHKQNGTQLWGPMISDIYQISFNWFTPSGPSVETVIIVTVHKKIKKGSTVIYERLGALEL